MRKLIKKAIKTKKNITVEIENSKQLNQVLGIKFKRILFDNKNFESDSTSQWYNGIVDSVEYTRDEDDENISNVAITFQCNVNEVIS